ncbi:TRUD domain-containing protein [Meloidogyne graminicola]|uniref:TRUD domain-containing protein n=1 Tax=Meloidogyne graminicola TaxID=189291 RepID=A0A8T0A2S8_9BILA|nr:TRUD domain-containing protein [Meloidogyne graminicola]
MVLNNISEYASDENWHELKCILKRLYSDFIVIEIPSDGNVLEPKFNDNICSEEVDEEEKEEQGNVDIVTLPKELECLNEQISKFSQILEGEINECIVNLKEFNKDVRKQLYGFIKNNYGSALMTDCKDGILTVKKSKGNASDTRKRKFWPSARGDYLHFTITKENMDTNTCIDLIASRLNLKPSLFSVSGSKDRRAITVQRVCAYRVNKQRLCRQHFRHLWLSDFVYSKIKLELGDAYGNHFSIILRDVDNNFNSEEFNNRIEKWKTNGFLNYFGSQRFGSCGVQTSEIGRLILNQKWEEAVKALLAPRSDAPERINKCLKHFNDSGNAKQALQLLNDRSAIIERSLLLFLSKYPNGYKGALLALPRNSRTMYIHAYQSAVFNHIVSKRKRIFGLKYLPGDLDIEGKILNDENLNKIENVCLPLPSFENKLPENEVGEWYKEIAKEDGIDYESFKKIERHFGLGNVYRPFIQKPQNVSWQLLNYSFRDEQLQNCEFIPKNEVNEIQKEKIKEENEENIKKAIKLKFNLSSGTYATIGLK